MISPACSKRVRKIASTTASASSLIVAKDPRHEGVGRFQPGSDPPECSARRNASAKVAI